MLLQRLVGYAILHYLPLRLFIGTTSVLFIYHALRFSISVRNTLRLTYILFVIMVARGHVHVLHVPSRYQYADIFTKGLASALFEEFRSSLNVRSSPTPTAGEC
ncbi:hypothetical protein Tco_0930921 [Tanacetum coccineum]